MTGRVLAVFVAVHFCIRPAAADDSLFKKHCAPCHPSVNQVAGRLTGTAEERRNRLDAVLRKHRRAPDDAVRDAVITYLLSLRTP